MQGHPDVIDCLKDLLRGELAARDQYFIHSRQYQHQGFVRLYERMDHEMQEETQHADAILRRILLLEGEPDMRPNAFTPGATVPEMLRTFNCGIGMVVVVPSDAAEATAATLRALGETVYQIGAIAERGAGAAVVVA